MRYVLQGFLLLGKLFVYKGLYSFMENQITQGSILQRTRSAYVATRVLDTPFWAIYNMLPVIIYKDLDATPFQLAIIIALKPLVSLFSTYWSSIVNNRPDRLISNILIARLLGYLPFFFFPFVSNPWYFIFAFALYMMFAVGIAPAWMELLKLNIPKQSREKVFSYTQAFGYMGGGLIPFCLGWILDGYDQAWRFLFPAAALFALFSFFFQRRMVVPHLKMPSLEAMPTDLYYHLLKPWKTAWTILKERPDFRIFQVGSMIIGCGLVIIQPALPVYFVDSLHLSYTELAVAITLCKGFGFACASPFWSKWIHNMDIYRLLSWIAVLGFIFPACLIMTQWELGWLFFGYICYGMMQSGNELIWNMSGPLFSGDKDSSAYTSVNLAAVGLRGCIIPFLGSLIAASFGAQTVMAASAGIMLMAIIPLYYYRSLAAEH